MRISPFDAQSRRHTAFAQVDVAPLVDDEVEVELDEEDLRVDTYRASGAGGQHVNKTDSAVRITHVPTGIVVQCQNERSQTQNKATAMRLLRARLLEEEERKRAEEMAAERGEQKAAEWGSQIRSYTLHPSTSGSRTTAPGHEVGDAEPACSTATSTASCASTCCSAARRRQVSAGVYRCRMAVRVAVGVSESSTPVEAFDDAAAEAAAALDAPCDLCARVRGRAAPRRTRSGSSRRSTSGSSPRT